MSFISAAFHKENERLVESVVECGICFERINTDPNFHALPSSSKNTAVCGIYLQDCRHTYCNVFLESFILSAIKERQYTLPLKCPEPSCKFSIEPHHRRIKNVIQREEDYDFFVRCNTEATIKGSISCPIKQCSAFMIVGDEVKMHPAFPSVSCTTCTVGFCFHCRYDL